MLTSTPAPNPNRHININNYCWTEHQRDAIIDPAERLGHGNDRSANMGQNATPAASILASNQGGHLGNNTVGASGLAAPGYAASLSNHQHSIQREKRGCACKNSRCLKLYCECFSRGEYCGLNCHCSNCKNNSENEHIRAETIS